MRVTDKTRTVIGQMILGRLTPGYMSQAVIGSTDEKSVVRIEAAGICESRVA